VYQDEALVMRLDAQNIPLSSSSMPSLTAAMLEALEVQPGKKTLEIGTGTGYNAALLSHLTGDPRLVTTIELDPDLASQAAQILQELVGPVKVLVGNGYHVAAEQHYERMIATASAPGIPPRGIANWQSGGDWSCLCWGV
jgi:protein-L-isoaspartate(D-aspartate) O-methyltransferase